jgi:hypothetical protein
LLRGGEKEAESKEKRGKSNEIRAKSKERKDIEHRA